MSRTDESAIYSSTAVLDELGLGLVLVDARGELAITNAIADDLGRRRARRAPPQLLVDYLLERASSSMPDSTRRDDPTWTGAQEVIEVWDDRGRSSLVGFRAVRSSRFGTIFTIRDITESARARGERETLERLSQVGRACARVAHEIGNPLAAIKATIQSIEREAKAAGLADPIAAVHREIDRLDDVLGQLLGFVRHRPPRRTRVGLDVLLDRARAALGGRLAHVGVTAKIAPMPPLWVDAEQLARVLANLLANAAEAMPGGGVVTIRAEAIGPSAVIRVEDEGPGIPPSQREKVFESFYTTKQAGTGLGLSVCYRIVSDHGGSLAVEGRDGGGTALRVTLPVARG